MSDLQELINRHSVTAAWFWVTSISVGPYAETEKFDAVFTRETAMVVGGGYRERRTFYIQGVVTGMGDSRRENGGEIVRPDMVGVLAHVIVDAHEVSQHPTFAAWADDCRNFNGDGRYSVADFEDYEINTQWHRVLVSWLGEEYDAFVKAAQEYAAEH